MLRSPVPHMTTQTVSWIEGIQSLHQGIPMHLRHDGGGRDGTVDSVSVYDRRLRDRNTRDLSSIDKDVIHKQLTIMGSWTFSISGQADCARYIAEKNLPVQELFTHSFSIDDAKAAYELFDTQTTGKGFIVPN